MTCFIILLKINDRGPGP